MIFVYNVLFIGYASDQGDCRGDTESLLNSYFCPKWAFWTARPVPKKMVMNYELLLRAGFFKFSWAKILFLHSNVRTKKLLDTKVKKIGEEVFLG